MPLRLIFTVLFAACAVWLSANDAALAQGRILSPVELAMEPTYTDLSLAVQQPDSVYKLSLVGQKIKDFPLEILFFRNLQELNLSENRLKTLPPEIGMLTNLQHINLFNNRIESLPDSIGKLRNLQTLYMGRNKMVSFPYRIVGLQSLRYLDIRANLFTLHEIDFIEKRLPKCEIVY
jgi:Leucine-rich repeat (LRR) protein